MADKREILYEWTGKHRQRLALAVDGAVLRWVDDPEDSGWFETDDVAPPDSELFWGIYLLVAERNKYKERASLASKLCGDWRRWVQMLLDGGKPHDGQRVIIASEMNFHQIVQGWVMEEKIDAARPGAVAH